MVGFLHDNTNQLKCQRFIVEKRLNDRTKQYKSKTN